MITIVIVIIVSSCYYYYYYLYTIILLKSVAVSKLQVAIIARLSREICQTVRID